MPVRQYRHRRTYNSSFTDTACEGLACARCEAEVVGCGVTPRRVRCLSYQTAGPSDRFTGTGQPCVAVDAAVARLPGDLADDDMLLGGLAHGDDWDGTDDR